MALGPGDAVSHAQEGRFHLQRCDWTAALETFRSGLTAWPEDADLHAGAGQALYHLRAFREAAAEFLAAVRSDPDHLSAHRYLAFVIESLQGGNESVGAWCNLGAALKRRDCFEDAALAYREALTRKPDCLRALVELGQIYLELARPREAIPHLEAAVLLAPEHMGAHIRLGDAYHLTGDHQRGWKHFGHYRNNAYNRDYEQPFWDGTSCANQTVLLWSDQGLGDSVQYSRYVPLVKSRARRVVLLCQPEMVSLMTYTAAADTVIGPHDPLPAFDVHAPLFSLPRIFLVEGVPLPDKVPYLAVDPQREERWRKRLGPSARPAVGIVWGSRATFHRARFKSVPVAQLLPLASIRSIRFVSLQLRTRTTELVETPDFDVEWPLGDSCDIADTAAVILSLDLVISVDTMVAHLAGALGKPVWTLVPFYSDWRWRLEGERCSWYPTMRLFRQTKLGDWRDVVQRVAEALACRWGEHEPTSGPNTTATCSSGKSAD